MASRAPSRRHRAHGLPPLIAAVALLAAARPAPAAAGLRPAAPAPAAPDSAAVALAPPPPETAAAAEPYYFYRKLRYGSESLVHPLRMVLNSGFGIMQVSNRDNHPFDIDYARGATNLWRNLRDPFGSIQNEGWGRFLREEVIPFSTNTKGARYWPNYTQHLIGGGMSWRLIGEWFRAHDWPRPGWWATATMFGYHALNEIVETSDYDGWTTDPVADMWLFDPAGILLFSSDKVARFFGETLHMADWSYQPCYDPWDRSLENMGQNFAMKLRLPRSERWHLFYNYGTHGEIGLSYWREDGHCISFGAGLMAGKLIQLEHGVRTVDLVPTAGVFWDRNNSLLASLMYARTQAYRLRLNIYPGVLRVGSWSPGLFAALNRQDTLVGGVTFSTGVPLGIAYDGP